MRWLRRMRAFPRRARLEREMRAELQQHLELEIEDRVRSGLSPEEARRTAYRDFGGEERWLEEGRGARGWGGYDAVAQDLRYAFRTLRAAPSFTIAALLTLGLAIGASTAVLSIADTVLLEPLGYPEPERLYRVLDYRQEEIGTGRGTISYANFADLRASARLWERASIYDEWQVSVMIDGVAERYDGAIVDAAWFEVLGVQPALGRFFSAEDSVPGGPARVVLSWGLWQQRFGADPGVLGRTIQTNGYDAVVIGVAPRTLEDPGMSGASFEAPKLWRSPGGYLLTNSRGARSVAGLVRLRPGVTQAQAQEEVDLLHTALAEQYPAENSGHVMRLVPLKETIVAGVRDELLLLVGAVALVLLIACANVGNLLLFRATVRSREMSVRAALGASRMRLLRQLLVESAVLAGCGAVLGGVLAWQGTTLFTRLAGEQLPRVSGVAADARLFLVLVLVTGFAALAFGLLPALQVSRARLGEALRSAGRGSAGTRAQARMRSVAVGVEVALAVAVIIGATLLGRSLVRLQAVDPGVQPDHVLTMELITPAEYEGDALTAYFARLFERVQRVPGVRHVAATNVLPMSGSFNGGPLEIVGAPPVAPQDRPGVEIRAVAPDYFSALGMPVLRGRALAAEDRADALPVTVISATLAERFFPGENPLGRRIDSYGAERVIVGVVGDVSMFSLEGGVEPTCYFPTAQAPDWMRTDPTLVVRVAGPPEAALDAIRRAVREVDVRVPVAHERTLRAVIDATLLLPRLRVALIAGFALIAFILAVIGVYATVAYSVTRRTLEFGIRAALGATRSTLLWTVVRGGMRPVLFGAAAGVLLGALLARTAAALLFRVSPLDPVAYLAAPLALLGVAAVAAAVPARRAAGVQPVAALRE